MFVHQVFFWLKPEASPEQREAFRRGLESLSEISHVSQVEIGTPVASKRPVVDSSYDFGLLCLFPSQEAHDAYQQDPIHQAFLGTYQPLWERVVVYDFT